MVQRDFGRVWVTGTVILISWISFSSQIGVIWPWYGSALSLDLLKLLVPFNALVFMVFWNYRLCVITPPGSVPLGWRPNLSQMDGIEVKRGSHAPRYCKTCEHYKPPRTHHCRQCKTCVLKLDHHCPWIANCVGFKNQGHFLRFLIYVDLATSYHLAMMVFRVIEVTSSWAAEPTLWDVLFIVFNFAACVPVWLCVGMFSLYHIYLAVGNSTTIERWEKDKVATLVRRGKIAEIKYPYNIGAFRNVQAVLGPNPLLWLWPQEMQGDGLSFPVNPEAGDSDVQYAWPPQDPTRMPNPPPIPAGASAFVYGGNSFNPALRPSNAAKRRQTSSESREELEMANLTGRGDDGWVSNSSRGSSPEPYMSDYDDENWGPRNSQEVQEEKLRRLEGKVRRGSEGFEVRPDVGSWNRIPSEPGPSWAERGRYNVYEPSHDFASDSD